MSIFTKVWTWLKKAFKYVESDGAKIAVAITEHIKDALNSGAVGFLASTIDNLLHIKVAEKITDFLKEEIPKILAAELAIEGLPANATEADIVAFEQKIIEAFGKIDNQSRLYTTIAAQAFLRLQQVFANLPAGTKPKWAELVIAIQDIYNDYKQDQQDFPNDNP